jgi:hypothetical protein
MHGSGGDDDGLGTDRAIAMPAAAVPASARPLLLAREGSLGNNYATYKT